MNAYRTLRLLRPLFLCLCLCLTVAQLPGQSNDDKIALMADALRARSQGDLLLARQKLERLITLSPNDANVQRLLMSVNEDIERHGPQRQPVAAPTSTAAMPGDIDDLVLAESQALRQASAKPAAQAPFDIKESIKQARKLARQGSLAPARELLATASQATDDPAQLEYIAEAEAYLLKKELDLALESGDLAKARALRQQLAASGAPATAAARDDELAELESDPDRYDLAEIAPDYIAREYKLADLLARGKARYIAGDFDGANEVFGQVEALDPNNTEAKYFLLQIASVRQRAGEINRLKTKEQMLQEISQGWQRPQIFDRDTTVGRAAEDRGLRGKLEAITLPRVNFAGIPLSRVLDTLSALSEEYDSEKVGINMVLIDPNGTDPLVNITLRQLSLDRILDFVTESVGYEYDVQNDAVVVRLGEGSGTRLETDFFPLSRSTIIRLTGIGSQDARTSAAVTDPFAPPPPPSATSGSSGEEEAALKQFLQRAGVPFETVSGANLALADGQLIVTQTPRNLEKVRNILRRYSEIKQVEIETRFLEVQEGDLEELGFQWNVRSDGLQQFAAGSADPILGSDGNPALAYRQNFNNTGRNLAGAFGVDGATNSLNISRQVASVNAQGVQSFTTQSSNVPQSAPILPNIIDLAADITGSTASLAGVVAGAQVDVLIRALERKSGNDLMSAPKVTVLSGKTAEIVVAQELLYPESFSDIEAEVGKGDSNSGGSAGVAITAGTPQDFVKRNVGVEMIVTPTVEDDGSISLLLEPQVTEFEGFVEYGGTSVAIASGTTVTVPSGFYQPIFSVRRMRTEVTIWDGATVVMGGLMREQAVSISDKVPVLGDIPLLGRLFRSEGESSQKRNLLIFVSANMISPGGSPARQEFRAVEPGSLFQNPAIVTPGGAVSRSTSAE